MARSSPLAPLARSVLPRNRVRSLNHTRHWREYRVVGISATTFWPHTNTNCLANVELVMKRSGRPSSFQRRAHPGCCSQTRSTSLLLVPCNEATERHQGDAEDKHL